jgi:hypothetical protein
LKAWLDRKNQIVERIERPGIGDGDDRRDACLTDPSRGKGESARRYLDSGWDGSDSAELHHRRIGDGG